MNNDLIPINAVIDKYDLFGNPVYDAKRSMADYFGVAPFSVINGADGLWNKRKKRWKSIIQDNGESRENTLYGVYEGDSIVSQKVSKFNNGVSILDPCLAEIVVKWFGEKGFKAFDPFAGDTVFGFVAAWFGLLFTGIELRKEQADFNQQRCDSNNLNTKYICDDARNMDDHIEDNSMDLVFSCPPYADLEVYSNDERDLSTLPHDQFIYEYSAILAKTYKKLKNNRFAVIVMGEVRGKDGGYIGTIPATIKAMRDAGYLYYNEAILQTPVGTLPMRTNKQMNTGRKIGKRHQNILCFYKGDPKEIRNNYRELIPKNKAYDK